MPDTLEINPPPLSPVELERMNRKHGLRSFDRAHVFCVWDTVCLVPIEGWYYEHQTLKACSILNVGHGSRYVWFKVKR